MRGSDNETESDGDSGRARETGRGESGSDRHRKKRRVIKVEKGTRTLTMGGAPSVGAA